MMGELDVLEREVEDARQRVAEDLSRLRSPTAVGEFKDDLLQGFVANLKERAAADPAAVMMIGAGLAWRLIKHPPIASLLVGVGAWSLLKQKGSREGLNGLASRAATLASDAGERVGEIRARASAIVDRASSSAAQVAATLKDTAADTATRAGDAAIQIRDRAMDGGNQARLAWQRMDADGKGRDQLLLGAATVAIAAAVGIAARDRIGAR